MEYQDALSIKDIEDVFMGEHKKSCLNVMDESVIEEFFISLTNKIYKDRNDYNTTVKELFKKHELNVSKTTLVHYYRRLLNEKKIKFNPSLEVFMKKRVARSASGVVVITVFTGPSKFSCPMDCHYCPQETDKDGNMTQPRSYLSSEPGCARAIHNNFDPIKQSLDRIASLEMTGHIEPTPDNPCKLEYIVSGGTFNFYPKDYLMEFMSSLYYACNCYYDFKRFYTTGKQVRENGGFPLASNSENFKVRKMMSIEEEQKINETATHRIIGLTIETRPDWITKKNEHYAENVDLSEIELFTRYGVTRIQIGVQHTDDYILKKINRKCTNIENKWGIFILKQNGFKVDIHIMLDLPYSSPEKDMKMLQEILDDKDYQADQWKLYPTMVVNWTKLKEWYDAGEYKPYADKDDRKLIDVLKYIKRQVHPWIRINRVIRDIPTKEIMGGTQCTNMRDIVLREMEKEKLPCQCLRCREVKFENYNPKDIWFSIDYYKASNGLEYFLSYTSWDKKILYGYLRLRMNNSNYGVMEHLHNTALVRELHVLGMQVSVNDNTQDKVQHKRLGTKLLKYAEWISYLHAYSKIAVISGVGVRKYYENRGYKLEKTYMVKYMINIKYTVSILLFFIATIYIILRWK
jgi:ELP3 family radical SAM enzyme/protein acetyltransferase